MTCKTQEFSGTPSMFHLRAALASVLAVILAMTGVEAYFRWRLPGNLNFFAEQMNSAKMLGNVVQTAAFRAPEVMPIYGSSEMRILADNRAEEFFLAHSEGFRVFPIGRPGNTCLLILEKIAAAGPAARGKKIGIFLSPTWFLRRDIHDPEIADNITPVQLGAWVFGDSLSGDFKRRFARRLLEHPAPLGKEPMMELALRALAGESPSDHLSFALLSPVGRLRNALLTRLDIWQECYDLLFLPVRSPKPMPQRWREPAEPVAETRWQHLSDKAEQYDRAHAVGTPYSVFVPTGDNANDALELDDRRASSIDRNLAPAVDRSKEWKDLALLIDGLKELGAEPIFINQPFNGLYRDQIGSDAAARRHYYDRVEGMVRASGYPMMDYSDHEEDKYFFNDSNHPSAKAWIYYDHALDDFFHSRGVFAGKRFLLTLSHHRP